LKKIIYLFCISLVSLSCKTQNVNKDATKGSAKDSTIVIIDTTVADDKVDTTEEVFLTKVHFEEGDMIMPLAELSAKTKKPIFIDFYFKGCAPCQIMDEYVYTDAAFADEWNKNFISIKIDAFNGNGPTLKDIYEVQGYPTLLFLDSKGNEIIRKTGGLSAKDLTKLGEQALLKFKKN
jgi:thiol-disulfide isomerase/thioredoxin